jgi:hypothetical protein
MIFLDDQTRPYIERLIKKQIEASDKDFIAKRLWKMLESDRERLETIGKCQHKPASYTGHKTCCVYCGSNYEEGMGEDWTLDPTLLSVKPKDET